MKFGCIGEHLPHSFSKEIHEKIASYAYEIKEIAPQDLDAFMIERDFQGINVTIPYKEKVIPYLDFISDSAKKIGAVNTVVNHGGKLYGYNTDYMGMKALARRIGISFKNKKVLILGTGGTGKTAYALVEDEGAGQILRVSPFDVEGAVSYEEVYAHHTDAQIILNTSPVGMFPKIGDQPVDLSKFPHLEGVLDVVYNPIMTELVLSAKKAGIPSEGGLYMLVGQAVFASEIFTGSHIPESTIDRVFGEILAEKLNVVLIGMPSSGKTTVGRKLAKRLNKEKVDIDEQITKDTGKTPAEIIREQGIEAFRAIEKQTVEKLAPRGGMVIATGGGTVLDPENVKNLRRNGRIFFLDRALEKLLVTSDRPLSDSGDKLKALYEERRPIYLSAADVKIDGNGSIENCVKQIEKELKK